MSDAPWIPVARIFKARGRKGELTAEIYSDKPERGEQFDEVRLALEGREYQTSVEELWRHDGLPVFKFAGIDSISDAEKWEGADVLVPPENKLQLDEGEYTYASLIGCCIIDRGMDVGVVTGLSESGGPVLLTVDVGGREVLIPFVKAICREIDPVQKVIQTELPEGLLDLG